MIDYGDSVKCVSTTAPEYLTVGAVYVIQPPNLEIGIGTHVINAEGRHVDIGFGTFVKELS